MNIHILYTGWLPRCIGKRPDKRPCLWDFDCAAQVNADAVLALYIPMLHEYPHPFFRLISLKNSVGELFDDVLLDDGGVFLPCDNTKLWALIKKWKYRQSDESCKRYRS